ncbi:hypothetical protein DL764_006249 [Monosporascus ibericus]|uniref:Fucose-specific lectin n=1 Tax=Monosporascus ibericus TaxID=155417 RepID=A0A4V1XA53_9PEZI|nr:hypothetical protein DL764_006249 [Monosporascus ibericus]
MDASQVPTPGHMFEYYSRGKYSVDYPSFSPDGPSTTHGKQWGSTGQQWETSGQQWVAGQANREGDTQVVDFAAPNGQTWENYAIGDVGQEGHVSDSSAVGGPSPAPLLPPEEEKQAQLVPYCGLKRRDFWILVAIVTMLLIGAIIGGILGAVTIKKNEVAAAGVTDTGHDLPTNTPTPVPTATFQGPTATESSLPREDRSIAASTVENKSTQSNYHVVYQDLTTLDLRYRLVWNDRPSGEQNLTLRIKPDIGTPLAVVAANSTVSDNVFLFIFYTTCEDQSNAPLLAVACLDCIPGAPSCTEVANNPIPVSHDLARTSSIAAVLTEDGRSLRVYYQAESGSIWVLRGNIADVHKWTTSRLSELAMVGTSIAAASIQRSPGKLQVIFVCREMGLLRSLEYDDVSGADEDQTPGSAWSTDAKFVASYTRATDTNHIHYVSPTQRRLVQYSRTGNSSEWTVEAELSQWGAPQSGLAAAAWDDKLRLIYEDDEKIVESALSGNDWEGPQELAP